MPTLHETGSHRLKTMVVHDKVDYISYHKKVKIICKKHGEFKQTPANHIKGKGCPSCSKNKILSTDECINLFKSIWGDIYNYSKFNYKRSSIKSIIICKKHGEFKQTPNNHMSGHGCSKCTSIISKQETKWLDSLGIKKENRQLSLPGLPKRWKVDGYDPEINTVYEFYGDYWHANPKKYNMQDSHIRKDKYKNHLTFKQVYDKTIYREQKIKNAGYNLVVIWEDEFNKGLNV